MKSSMLDLSPSVVGVCLEVDLYCQHRLCQQPLRQRREAGRHLRPGWHGQGLPPLAYCLLAVQEVSSMRRHGQCTSKVSPGSSGHTGCELDEEARPMHEQSLATAWEETACMVQHHPQPVGRGRVSSMLARTHY
jgi:hypothetical protein